MPEVSSSRSGRPRFRLIVLLGLLVLLAGCPAAEPRKDDPSPGQPGAPAKLRLLVVGDPELATAVERLADEWNGQTGSEFKVERVPDQDPISPEKLDADVILCPSYHVGGMVEREEIRPVPEELLGDMGGNWSQIFSLLRADEAALRGKAMAIPLGSPILTCYYRADLLEKLGRQPPRTWAEYQKLAELLADRKSLGDAAPPPDRPWHGAYEPLGPRWAGLVLLARAAAYASHRGNYSTLFNVDTMTPLIDGPPFVRALTELVAAAKLGPAGQTSADPAAARKAFWAGECGLALTWPTAAVKIPPPADRNLRVGFAELPGSKDVYNVSAQSWETRRENEDPRVPLLAVAGRVGVVSSRAPSPEMAFRLLFWLSDDQWSKQAKPVSAASPMTTLFRASHLKGPREWVEEPIRLAAAAQYAAATERVLSRPRGMLPLSIPGHCEYLAALDEAVHRAIRGEQTPEAALRQAASTWQQITDRLGRQSQRQAYGHSVGLD